MKATGFGWLALTVGILSMLLLAACSSGGGDDDDDGGDGDDDSSPADDDDNDNDDNDTSPTDCMIEGVTYAAGDTNPLNVCLVCDPNESTENWTMNDGAACDDGVFCNGADVCLGGMCSVHNEGMCQDNNLFCDGVESCNEVNDRCNDPYDPCGTDETCREQNDFCEPTADTCHGAAWSVNDKCGYVLKDWHNNILSTDQIEVWCNDVEAEYAKGMQGVYFSCMDDCARNQSCSSTCLNGCADADDPGSGCGHVEAELYGCGLVQRIAGTEYYFQLPDALALCGAWDHDWDCYQWCYDEHGDDCPSSQGATDVANCIAYNCTGSGDDDDDDDTYASE